MKGDKVNVIYRMYCGFPLIVAEHTVGSKMIDTQRISGLTLYKYNPDNLEKGNECNKKLREIKKLEDEIRAIGKTMEEYFD